MHLYQLNKLIVVSLTTIIGWIISYLNCCVTTENILPVTDRYQPYLKTVIKTIKFDLQKQIKNKLGNPIFSITKGTSELILELICLK